MEDPTCPPTPPLSTCPATPPRAGSPKSSPSQIDKSSAKDRSPSPTSSRPASPEKCAICLGSLTNKSFTNSCLHQFCFVCLLEWSKVKAECPLCKIAFNSIIHNVRSQDDYDQYHVKQNPRPLVDVSFPNHYPFRATLTYHEFSEWMVRQARPIGSALSIHDAIPSRWQPWNVRAVHTRGRNNTVGTSDFRRSIYTQDLWASLQPDVTGRYRECSSEFYRQNPAQLHRLIPFLNRELNVLLDNCSRTAHVLSKIMELIPRFNLHSTEFRSRVAELIGSQHAAHFCHELRAYASSPYDITGYDRAAQYFPNPANNYSTEVTEISSPSVSHSSDSDSDVEVIDLTNESSARRQGSVSFEYRVESDLPHAHFRPFPVHPQPGTSGLGARQIPVQVDVLSSSSSESDVEDVQIVGYVKPRHERTPEIITLSSPERLNSTIDVQNQSDDENNDLVCVNLGNAATSVSWNENNSAASVTWTDVLSSDDDGGPLEIKPRLRVQPSRKSSKGGMRPSTKLLDNVLSEVSSAESFSDPSDREYESRSKSRKHKIIKRKGSTRTQTQSRCNNSRKGHHQGFSSDSDGETESPAQCRRSKKQSDNGCHKHSSSDSEGQPESSPQRSRSKRKNDKGRRPSHRSPRVSDCSHSGHHVSRQSETETSSPSRTSSHSKTNAPKLKSIVMTRTKSGDGHDSWSVENSRESSPPDRNHSVASSSQSRGEREQSKTRSHSERSSSPRSKKNRGSQDSRDERSKKKKKRKSKSHESPSPSRHRKKKRSKPLKCDESDSY